MTGQCFNVHEASTASTALGEAGAGSSGSTKTVACRQRSALELGTAALGLATGGCPQPKGEALAEGQPADRSVVVGDGRADHMAKGPAVEQREHSTHAGTRTIPNQIVSRSLFALSDNATWVGQGLVSAPTPAQVHGVLTFVAASIARSIEEPGAVIPHAGICEGAARQRAVLP
jgi:hypothetical protein